MVSTLALIFCLDGSAYVTGGTSSNAASFPVLVGPDMSYNGGVNDAFVAKVRALGGDVAGCSLPAGTAFHPPMGTRPVISLWPTLVPRTEVSEKLIIKKTE